MGKSKKGKKDVDVNEASDGEIEQQPPKDLSEEEEQETSKKAGKKSKKNKTKTKVEESESETDETQLKSTVLKPKKESKKKSKAEDSDDGELLPSQPISAFALLQGDDSDDDVGVAVKDDIEDEPAKKPSKQKKKSKKKDHDDDDDAPTATSGKKEKKKKKKRGDSDEDDLDKMLAELQLEYEGVKKPEEVKKDNKIKETEQTIVTNEKAEVEQEKTTSKKKDKKKKKTVADEKDESKLPETTETTAIPEVTESTPPATEETGAGAGPKKKKGPGKAMVAAMQEALKKKKEEEERLEREEEERIRLLEEAEKMREEAKRLETEKKERKKQKEKEKKERLKAEGKLLTAKQKADKARAEAMIESLKAQGAAVPGAGERRVRPGTRVRPSKQKKEEGSSSKEVKPEQEEEVKVVEEPAVEKEVIVEEPPKEEVKPEPVEEIKDAWDVSSDEEGDEDETPPDSEERIRKREAEAETKRTLDQLRAAVVCVLGHVDTGKTKILDKLRRTNVQDGEAGGITQQIGATNVPIEAIKENTRHLRNINDVVFKLPGLLIIDTPGHESFSNLRSRGSSLCDIAILVVDIMHGLEPQTIESLNLLKTRKTPFVVALNKIDRLYDWNTMPRKDIRDIIKAQAMNTQQEFDKRVKEVIVQFAEQGMNAALFYDNPDPRSYISMVPTSAISGEGMGNLLMLIVQFSQNQLAKRLMFSETLQATVLEVKAIPGLGTTIDTILINGKMREGDTMILAGTEGPIVTQIKALLMPQPMKELRVKNAYIEHKEVIAAQGVKIAAKELEKAIAGINMQIAQKADEIEIYKDIVARDLKSVLRSIKLSDQGVFVQASTLGSLEALLEFLKTSKIP
ncbi:CLUMA_CG004012, isoform A, partial [Clunio marinus]